MFDVRPFILHLNKALFCWEMFCISINQMGLIIKTQNKVYLIMWQGLFFFKSEYALQMIENERLDTFACKFRKMKRFFVKSH